MECNKEEVIVYSWVIVIIYSFISIVPVKLTQQLIDAGFMKKDFKYIQRSSNCIFMVPSIASAKNASIIPAKKVTLFGENKDDI